jgi:transposase
MADAILPDMETLTMSRSERKRMTIMAGVKRKELSLVQAAELMGLGYRQAKRLWRRYQDEGDAGLIHRLRGRAGLRRKAPAVRAQVLVRYAEERYADFGPTLLAEELAKEGIEVDHDTVRRWLLAAGKLTVRRRKQQHRQWRERKPCFGAMVQLDGSHHDWFEGRRAKCVLMVMVDDATNRMRARFSEEETTRASYDVFAGWGRQHRLPGSLYVDRDSIYRCEGRASVADQLAGKARQTQFGRAMAALGVELILANSPQAKGRVERMNGVLQDRLVKALRLAQINDLESANRFLEATYLREFNRRFARKAASPLDAHQGLPRNLDEVLSWEEERVVQRDWTVACEGKWYQLDKQHEALSLAGRKVVVRTLRNGQVQLVHRGQKLKWRQLPSRPVRLQEVKPAKAAREIRLPAANHPWRRSVLSGAERAVRFGQGDSGRPSLRSGLPASPCPNQEHQQTTSTNKRGHSLVSYQGDISNKF